MKKLSFIDTVEVEEVVFNKVDNEVIFICSDLTELDIDPITVNIRYKGKLQLMYLRQYILDHSHEHFSNWGEATNSLVGKILSINNRRQFQ